MARCIVCGCELNDSNSTEEHILLNAIGGHLKSKELLCKQHNSVFGKECDAELANQLQVLSSNFQVQRQRGKNPAIEGTTASGERYRIEDGINPVKVKPTVEIDDIEGGKSIHIEARNEKELRQILKGIKAKYPKLNIDIEDVVAKGTRVSKRLDEHVNFHLTIGGELAFRSIAKTAVEYYVLKTGDVDTVSHLIPYLKGDEEKNVVRIFMTQEPVCRLEPGEVCHLIHLESNIKDRLLYAYVEFYSVFSFLVLLSNCYNGSEVNETYCFELNQVKELKKDIKLGLTKIDINMTHKPDTLDWAVVEMRSNRFLKICQIRQIFAETCDKLKNNLCSSCGLTEEEVNKIAEGVGWMMIRAYDN